MNQTVNITKELYKLAPEEIADATVSDEMFSTLAEMSKTSVIDRNRLEEVVVQILLGMIPLEKMEEKIIELLAIPQEKGHIVSEEIRTKIISKIPRSLLEEQQQLAEKMIREQGPKEFPTGEVSETKEEALQRLKSVRIEKQSTPVSSLPIEAPDNLPMVEEGETVHDVTPMTEIEKEEIKQEQEVIIPIKVITPEVAEPKIEVKEEIKLQEPLAVIAEPEVKLEIKEEIKPIEAAPVVKTETITPEIKPATTAVKPVATKPTPLNPHYSGGSDPYREPIE